ncbi:MAG: PKD domain-containing protein [Pseudobdellovibrionaceae bacterium]
MKTSMWLLILSSLFLSACQKSGAPGEGENTSVSEGLQSSASCQQGKSQNVSMLGTENLKSGLATALSLSPGVNCDSAQKAVWTVGDTYLGSGSEIKAKIQGSGVYFISVALPPEVSANQNKSVSEMTISTRVAVADSALLIEGPQAGFADQPLTFTLKSPEGVALSEAQWDFGDESAIENSLSSITHAFPEGTFTITVTAKDENGQSLTVQHLISILQLPEGQFCPLDQLDIAGPTEVPLDRLVTYSVNLTDCLKTQVTQIVWNFGDGSGSATGAQAGHRFATAGDFEITAEVFLNNRSLTLHRFITVSDNLEEMPGPISDPNDPNHCLNEGASRVQEGATSTEEVACGADGKKIMTYREQITQKCQISGEFLVWSEISRERVLINEGACLGQSCQITTENGTENLKDGESRSLYTSKTPVDSCQSVQQTRLCQNGVLSGSNEAKYLTCHNGCGDFGSHGSTQTGVVTGETSEAVTCAFGEQGITSTYQLVSDLVCQDGSVQTTNTRKGEIKTAGLCPTYSFVASNQWSTCSADCGGKQQQVFECRDNLGQVTEASRCSGSAPLVERLCDANPEAVRRSESSVSTEEAGSSATCPKNQIGVILQSREVTTTTTYACQDHQVQAVDSQVTAGPWVQETYCRDLVPYRCSHDSLTNEQAKGRLAWMKKCADQIPAVKEFLSSMTEAQYKGLHIDEGVRLLYPTFMDPKSKKPWIAPKAKTSSCQAPAGAYIGAVCVSSCATPDQMILAQAQKERNMKNVSFIQALTEQMPWVGTLHSASSMSSKTVAKSAVDNWVTELFDEDHEILVFTMKSGGQLKVTPNHPILAQSGVMKLAHDFQVGESLVQLGGILDPIVSIEKTIFHGKVYNLFVKSNDLKKNVVVVNGYLNGTAFYQNEGAKFMNRALFRENLFRGAFENKGRP